jgi:hypothetical protein
MCLGGEARRRQPLEGICTGFESRTLHQFLRGLATATTTETGMYLRNFGWLCKQHFFRENLFGGAQ